MNTKQFAQSAIKNGYTDNLTEGWDWIRDNLSELDYIFSTPEYKEQKGMNYKCMPFLLKDNTLTDLEKRALDAAWYLNNERVREQEKADYKAKMFKDGWIELTEDVVKNAWANKKKIQVNASHSVDWMGYKIDNIYKPWVGETSNTVMLMKPKARSRGYYLSHFENAFCKII